MTFGIFMASVSRKILDSGGRFGKSGVKKVVLADKGGVNFFLDKCQ